MIEERGIVTKVEGGSAFVQKPRSRKCENCSGKGSCMVLEHADEVIIKVNNTLNARPGDEVSLQIGQQSHTKKRLLLFFVAIFALISGGAVGRFCSRFTAGTIAELLPTAFGLGSLSIVVILWRKYYKHQEQRQPQPIMEKIIRSKSQEKHGNQINLQQQKSPAQLRNSRNL